MIPGSHGNIFDDDTLELTPLYFAGLHLYHRELPEYKTYRKFNNVLDMLESCIRSLNIILEYTIESGVQQVGINITLGKTE
jgi:hypothetical protein